MSSRRRLLSNKDVGENSPSLISLPPSLPVYVPNASMGGVPSSVLLVPTIAGISLSKETLVVSV